MWNNEFKKLLPLLGHRNWILIVDKAFPLQSAAGMTYLDSNEELPTVLNSVLSSIDKASHLKPVIYTDKELEVLPKIGESEGQMVAQIKECLGEREINSILHDDVFKKIDAASKLFNVLVIKTESTIAYSSVFIELDCGYWTAEKEQKLRELCI